MPGPKKPEIIDTLFSDYFTGAYTGEMVTLDNS